MRGFALPQGGESATIVERPTRPSCHSIITGGALRTNSREPGFPRGIVRTMPCARNRKWSRARTGHDSGTPLEDLDKRILAPSTLLSDAKWHLGEVAKLLRGLEHVPSASVIGWTDNRDRPSNLGRETGNGLCARGLSRAVGHSGFQPSLNPGNEIDDVFLDR